MNTSGVIENEQMRSQYMRGLIQRTAITDAPPRFEAIPKVVVQFWDDLTTMPSDVRECLDSWKQLDRRGFRRLLFDDNRARRFIATSFGRRHTAALDRCGHPAMRCDYFRLCFLTRYGGFYVDADDYFYGGDTDHLGRDNRLKLQPLCYDASTDTMVAPKIFMQPENDSPDWIYYVNNNPIIGPPAHPVIRLALARATRLLLSDTNDARDIQSTTGPGNLTASLVRYSINSGGSRTLADVAILPDWESVSESRWPLSYRDDERNWRIWRRSP